MKEQELNNLLDKAIGTKGNLQVHSYWMNKTLKGIMEYNKTLINDIPSIPTNISYFDNDIGYVDHNYVDPIIKTINTELGIYNGVYAVTPDMDLVDYANADNKCIGVAVITDEFKIMINKYWLLSSTWASNLSNYNIAGITDCSTITNVSNDLDGENNTKYLKRAYEYYGVNVGYNDMQNKLDKLNSDQSLNGGINDWYIPSGGQLYNIKKYKEDIDAILRKLRGATLPSRIWTSSEYDYKEAWMADFYKDSFFERVQKTTYSLVLVVKNIETKSLKLRLLELEIDSSKLDPRVTNTETLIEQINEALVNKADITEIPTKVSLLINDNTYVLNMDIGVYAITAEGNLVTYDDADANCIAIALITANLQIMIDKKKPIDASSINGNLAQFYWCYELDGVNVADITDASSASQAMLDYNGKHNTQAIITAYNQLDLDTITIGNLHKYIQDFNNTNLYNDWYVPSCGLLYEIYLNKEAITKMARKIGGDVFSTVYYYISSSEYSANQCWSVNFMQSDEVIIQRNKTDLGLILCIRDIKVPTFKDSVTELNTKVSEAEVSISELLSNVYTKSEVDAKILELQTLINNYINGTSQVSELDA